MVKPKAAELAHRVQPPEKKKKKVIKITAPNISNVILSYHFMI